MRRSETRGKIAALRRFSAAEGLGSCERDDFAGTWEGEEHTICRSSIGRLGKSVKVLGAVTSVDLGLNSSALEEVLGSGTGWLENEE